MTTTLATGAQRAPARVAEPTADTAAARPIRTSHRRGTVALAALVAGLALVSLLSLLVGARELTFNEIAQALRHQGSTEIQILVWQLRVPRTVIALVVGAALGVSGALIQSFTRNPLADPGILGVNAGAAFAITLLVTVAGQQQPAALVPIGMLGAGAATVAVLALGAVGRGRPTPLRMTLAGVALAAVLSGCGAALRLLNPSTFEQMRAWAAGAVTGRDLATLAPALPPIAVGLVLALLLARSLNAVALGDERASSLGVNVAATRVATVLAVTLLCGSATALAGPIGFVGLMVPHAIRWTVGHDQRWIIGLSALAAPVVLLCSDVLGRVVMAERELPVGVVTAFVGAPVLIALALRRRSGGL